MTVSSWDKLVNQNLDSGSSSESDTSDEDVPLSQASTVKQKEPILKHAITEPSNNEHRMKREMTNSQDAQVDDSSMGSFSVLKAEYDSDGPLSAISKEEEKKNKKKRNISSVDDHKSQDKDIDSDTSLKKIKLEKKQKKKKKKIE